MKKSPQTNWKRYYWVLAGIVVGIYSVIMAWYNMRILVSSGDLTLGSSLFVILEYTLLIYLLSLIYNRVK